MATPTLLSVSNVALPNTADSGNVSVTAPSGANACVIGGTFYVGDNSVASSLTGSQLSFTTNGGLRTATPSGGNYMSSYAAAFQVNATGSQTIRLQKTGGYQEGPTCQIAWLTVDDPTDFVRTGGFLIDSQNSTPDTLSVTVNSATTDLVLGMFGTDGSSADPSAPSGTTQQGTLQTTQFDKSITFTVNSPGASTTTITAGSRDYPTLFGIALKAGGGLSQVTVNLSVTDAADTLSGTAGVRVGVGLSTTDAADTLSATATLPVAVNLSVTDAADTLSAAATLPISVALGVTDAADTLAASAGVGVSVGLAVSDEADTLESTVTIGDAPVTVNLTVTDAADTLSATATLPVGVALSVTDASDTLSAASTMPVTVNAGATDAADTLASTVGAVVGVALGVTDEADTLSATAIVQQEGVISVTLDVVDDPDTLAATAVLGPAPQPSGSGGRNWLIDVPVDARVVVANITDEDDTLVSAVTVKWSSAKVRKLMAQHAKQLAPRGVAVQALVVDDDDTMLCRASVRWAPVELLRKDPLIRAGSSHLPAAARGPR